MTKRRNIALVGLLALVAGIVIGVGAGSRQWDQSASISALRVSLVAARGRQHTLGTRLATATKSLALAKSQLSAARLRQPVPACPHLIYGADGSIGPIACTVINPPALSWARRIAPQLFHLGPNATPQQVGAAVQPGITFPIECELYQVAQLIRGWQFGVQIVPYCTNLPRTQG